MTDPNDLKITAKLIYREFERRGVPIEVIDSSMGLLLYTDYEGEKHYLRSTLSDRENAQAYVIAKNKYLTMLFCSRLNLPHPLTYLSTDQASESIIAEGRSAVVKPLDGAHGEGITVGVDNLIDLGKAVERAQRVSSKVLIQERIAGDDYRVLFIGGEFAAAIRRSPACVIGDGISTVRGLIEIENMNPLRGSNYEKSLEYIPIDSAALYLGDKLDTYIPENGEKVQVVGVANLSSGGSAQDATEIIPKSMIDYSARLVNELRMGICGVDFMWSGNQEDEPMIIEINATPGIDMHDDSMFGTPRNTIPRFVDFLLSKQ